MVPFAFLVYVSLVDVSDFMFACIMDSILSTYEAFASVPRVCVEVELSVTKYSKLINIAHYFVLEFQTYRLPEPYLINTLKCRKSREI